MAFNLLMHKVKHLFLLNTSTINAYTHIKEDNLVHTLGKIVYECNIYTFLKTYLPHFVFLYIISIINYFFPPG
ncbi:hypothetical protein GCM10028819_05590 [Spirosoma humi]